MTAGEATNEAVLLRLKKATPRPELPERKHTGVLFGATVQAGSRYVVWCAARGVLSEHRKLSAARRQRHLHARTCCATGTECYYSKTAMLVHPAVLRCVDGVWIPILNEVAETRAATATAFA
jgi:hypothetical protein